MINIQKQLKEAEDKGWNDAIREAIAILENDLDNWPWGRPPIELLRRIRRDNRKEL